MPSYEFSKNAKTNFTENNFTSRRRMIFSLINNFVIATHVNNIMDLRANLRIPNFLIVPADIALEQFRIARNNNYVGNDFRYVHILQQDRPNPDDDPAPQLIELEGGDNCAVYANWSPAQFKALCKHLSENYGAHFRSFNLE